MIWIIYGYLSGLYGKNEVEATRIDVACECIQDLVTPLMKMFFEKDEAKKVNELLHIVTWRIRAVGKYTGFLYDLVRIWL